MSDLSELSTKDALAVARGFRVEMNRRMASFVRLEEVLLKAQEVDAKIEEYEAAKADATARYNKAVEDANQAEEEAERRKAEAMGELAKYENDVKHRMSQLDLDIRGKEAKVARLVEKVARLTAILDVAEEKPEGEGVDG